MVPTVGRFSQYGFLDILDDTLDYQSTISYVASHTHFLISLSSTSYHEITTLLLVLLNSFSLF